MPTPFHSRFLAACEREPLHHSGAIQAHGTLLGVDGSGRIQHVAANLSEWLGMIPQVLLGTPLPERLARLVHDLPARSGARLTLEAALQGPQRMLDLIASRDTQGGIIMELTAHQPVARKPPLAALPKPPRDEAGLAADRDALVQRIAELTGFQRVMYYQFIDEGDGEVIAETRQGDVYGSYLGLRFPASDIPAIARALYLNNPWRLIPDATVEPVPLLGTDRTTPDLTWSDLRSVSPVHRLYLANMGVRASLSFPIVIGGKLVALIACHHNDVRIPPLALLEQAAQLTQGHALACTSYQASRRISLVDGLESHFDAAWSILQQHGDPLAAWPELGTWLMREFHSEGATLCLGDVCSGTGTGFEPAVLAFLDNWFCGHPGEFLWSSDSLTRDIPDFPLSSIAGVLALRAKLSAGRVLRVYLCRQEHIHEVAWGGNPEKPVEYHDGAIGIAPRHSFETWLEQRLGYSRPWNSEARLLALNLRALLMREIH